MVCKAGGRAWRATVGTAHRLGQQRGLVTIASADLQYLFGAGQAERRDHRGRQRRLGGHLLVGDGNGRVVLGPGGVGGQHERRPRRAPDRLQHARISDAARAAATRSCGPVSR